jgi:hypothetical protein
MYAHEPEIGEAPPVGFGTATGQAAPALVAYPHQRAKGCRSHTKSQACRALDPARSQQEPLDGLCVAQVVGIATRIPTTVRDAGGAAPATLLPL